MSLRLAHGLRDFLYGSTFQKSIKNHDKILAVILILAACVVAGCNNEIKIDKIDGLTHAFTLCQNVQISVNM